MYCAKCGSELIENAAFCSKCGEAVKGNSKDDKVTKKEEVKVQESETPDVEYQTASQGRRFVNFLIDYILVIRFIIPFSVGVMFPYEDETTWYIFTLLFTILYFFILETFTGKTLGKLITGTRVLNVLDEKPTAGQVIIRTLCRFIPFDAFSYLSKTPVGWHDSISKTYVVEKVR